jgi:hypothetical protein
MQIRRRAVLGAGVALALSGLHRAFAIPQQGQSAAPALIPDPHGIIDLLPGWRYQIISRTGDAMSDGLRVPGDPDGMACFALDANRVVLMRNHEISESEPEKGPGAGYTDAIYDPAMMGGVSRIVYNLKTGQVEDQRLALLGTVNNCAGGPTPWGSWLTCEETMLRTSKDGAQHDHGYVFEVPVTGTATALPLTAMGRFRHEAAAVDPRTGIVYLTEDRPDGLLYRFLPNEKAKLHKGGRLQALCAEPLHTQGASVRTHWIDLDHVESPDDDLRARGAKRGALPFARGEGIWWSPRGIYFTATTGGAKALGQVFCYHPRSETLTLYTQPESADVMCMGDNLTVLPDGGLMVCEDREAGTNRIRHIAPNGRVLPFARNAMADNGEFAGICATRDGKTLFVNIQNPGLTLALTQV